MPAISFGRRKLLMALAAVPATLPLARMLHAGPSAPPPKRLFLVMQNNGTQQANFWPSSGLRSPILDALFTDPATGNPDALGAKATVVKGVYVPNDANGTSGNQHDMGFARMFTGSKLVSKGGQPWGGGPSVDQIVANAWNVDSLTLAVLASQTEPHPKPGFDHRQSFSYLAPATIKHPRTDPLDVYRLLFPAAAGVDGARRLALRKSVLDGVAGNLGEISARLGPSERAKLDYHLTAVRELETRLARNAGACVAAPAAPRDYFAIDPGSEVNEDTYIPAMVDDMLDLATASLVCGITRIATVQLGYGGGKWRFGWQGIDMNCHDDVAHLDTSDPGSTPDTTRRVVLMNQYYASKVARLATALDAVPEGSGTMLDNTLVVWANEMGRGDHNLTNVPIVLLGGGLPRGGRVIDAGPQVFNRLGCTVLRLMGQKAAGFGDVPDCGVFQGLV